MTVVVVAYGKETPLLSRCIASCLASEGVTVEVVIVDNGSSDCTVAALPSGPHLVILKPGANAGFAAGRDLGAARATSRTIAFVNPNAIVDSPAFAILAGALNDKRFKIVMRGRAIAKRTRRAELCRGTDPFPKTGRASDLHLRLPSPRACVARERLFRAILLKGRYCGFRTIGRGPITSPNANQ